MIDCFLVHLSRRVMREMIKNEKDTHLVSLQIKTLQQRLMKLLGKMPKVIMLKQNGFRPKGSWLHGSESIYGYDIFVQIFVGNI